MGRTSDSRQRLMDAAHELIWECSYGAVTIAAICERASVRKGSFYYFFESKSDLAVAAIEDWWVKRQAFVEKLFRPEVPPMDRIGGYFDHAARSQIEAYESDGRILGCPLFTLGSEICTQDERIRSLIQEILVACVQYFESAIRDAQACGDLAGNNAPLKARQLWSFYEGTLTRARIENDPELVRNLHADAFELIGAKPCLIAAA